MTMINKRIVQGLYASGILLLSGAATCESGERRYRGCPEGEECSLLVSGLDFYGASLNDDFLFFDHHPTAVGGRQRFKLSVWHSFDDDDDTSVQDRAAMEGSQAIVVGDGFDIAQDDHQHVDLHPTAASNNTLQIIDRDGLLMDSIEIRSAEITSVRIRSVGKLFAPGGIGTIQLHSASGERLVDQDMKISAEGISQNSDTFVVGDLALGPHSVMVQAGNRPQVKLDFTVATVDHLEGYRGWNTGSPLVAQSGDLYCFPATHGSARIPILTGYTFEVTNATIEGMVAAYPQCVVITPQAAGPLSITAHAGNQTVTVTGDVQPASNKPRAHAKTFETSTPHAFAIPGVRASAQ
jgi:hypothetical protein